MDEHARRAEREAARDGSASARVRLAHAHRRSGRWPDVLAVTEGLTEPGALAVRAEALLHAGQVEAAVDTAGAARLADPDALGADLAGELARALLATERAADPVGRVAALARASRLGSGAASVLEPALRDRDLLVRAQAARVPELGDLLVDDPAPLVRFVARRAREGDAALRAVCTSTPQEPPRTRLFSAHGPDFEFGLFVVFDASGEARFSFIDLALFQAVDRLLGGPVRRLGFSKGGYGLGVPSRTAIGDLEDEVRALDASGALPFPLRLDRQPYDPLDDLAGASDDLLCGGYVRDLKWHPVRHFGAGPDSPVYARVAAALRPNRPEDVSDVTALLAQARDLYTPIGVRALEQFVRLEREEQRDSSARRQRSAEKGAAQPMSGDDGRS